MRFAAVLAGLTLAALPGDAARAIRGGMYGRVGGKPRRGWPGP